MHAEYANVARILDCDAKDCSDRSGEFEAGRDSAKLTLTFSFDQLCRSPLQKMKDKSSKLQLSNGKQKLVRSDQSNFVIRNSTRLLNRRLQGSQHSIWLVSSPENSLAAAIRALGAQRTIRDESRSLLHRHKGEFGEAYARILSFALAQNAANDRPAAAGPHEENRC